MLLHLRSIHGRYESDVVIAAACRSEARERRRREVKSSPVGGSAAGTASPHVTPMAVSLSVMRPRQAVQLSSFFFQLASVQRGLPLLRPPTRAFSLVRHRPPAP